MSGRIQQRLVILITRDLVRRKFIHLQETDLHHMEHLHQARAILLLQGLTLLLEVIQARQLTSRGVDQPQLVLREVAVIQVEAVQDPTEVHRPDQVLVALHPELDQEEAEAARREDSNNNLYSSLNYSK